MSITVQISTQDGATPAIEAIRGELSRDDVRKAMGFSVAEALKAHFFKLDDERANKMGGKRTNFYGQAARGVQQPQMESDGFSVSINQVGIAQRYFGGTIVPTEGKKYLTIPANAEAYGRRAGEFADLKVMFGKGRRPVGLYQGANQKTAVVMFWLVKSVTQAADSSVIPDGDTLLGPAIAAGSAYLERLWARQQDGGTPA